MSRAVYHVATHLVIDGMLSPVSVTAQLIKTDGGIEYIGNATHAKECVLTISGDERVCYIDTNTKRTVREQHPIQYIEEVVNLIEQKLLDMVKI